MILAVCDVCARTVALDNSGRLRRHDQVGVVVAARTGKRRRRCSGSGRWPRRVEP
jgi:hypothetical protein